MPNSIIKRYKIKDFQKIFVAIDRMSVYNKMQLQIVANWCLKIQLAESWFSIYNRVTEFCIYTRTTLAPKMGEGAVRAVIFRRIRE